MLTTARDGKQRKSKGKWIQFFSISHDLFGASICKPIPMVWEMLTVMRGNMSEILFRHE
jgi:hypothetical protein